MRRAAVALSEDTGVGAVYFSEDEVVTLSQMSAGRLISGLRHGERRESYDIPHTVERRHDADKELRLLSVKPINPSTRGQRNTHHDISQSFSMVNEPTSNQQPHSKQDGHDGQPVLPGPPQGEQETDDVEAAEDEQGPDDRRPQVSRWKGDEAFAAFHVRHPALVGVEGDGDHFTTRAAGCYCMAELVKGYH